MKRNRIWLLACILWVGLIFGHSLMPAELSGAESEGFLAILTSFVPMLTDHLLRKLAHFSEFAVLGLLLYQACAKKTMLPLFAGLLCALCDETIQFFVAGRSSQVSDVWIDFGGVAFAIAISFSICSLRKQKQ